MTLRRLCALLLAGAATTAVTACGDEVPDGAIAKIDDQTIQRSTFDHWMQVAATQLAPQSGGRAAVPKPPDFAGCVAAKRKAAPKPAKGQRKPTDDQLRSQCKREYDQLREQVLNFLIAANWVEGEAADQGVTVTDKELQQAIDRVRKASFPNQAAFERYLRQTGLTMQDVRFQTRVEQLQNKLVAKIQRGQDKVTEAQINRYYDRNKQRFGQPERRDIEVVLTRSEQRAQQAKRALESGRSFRSVVRRFSEDDTTKQQGGKIPGVTRGQQLEKALDEAVFRAQRGEIVGPVKTQFGHYVFRVTRITPAKQQPLGEARTTIRDLLQQQGRQRALETFVRKYREKWTEQTYCRKEFLVESCGNAPKKPRRDPQPQPAQQPTDR